MQRLAGMMDIIAIYVSDGIYYIDKTATKYIPTIETRIVTTEAMLKSSICCFPELQKNEMDDIMIALRFIMQ